MAASSALSINSSKRFLSSFEISRLMCPAFLGPSSRGQPLHALAVWLRKVDHYWIHEFLVIIEFHPNRLIMCAGVEFNLVVPGKLHIAVDRHVEDVSERRHRSQFACRKCITKFALGC